MIILIERVFWWDYSDITIAGHRYEKYLPLQTIDDLLDQFNYVGFTDLCIYPHTDMENMKFYNNPASTDSKGISAVYYGHTNQNQTGK